MDKTVFFLSLCFALCATSFALDHAYGEDQWGDFDDSWYDEELENLGIVSKENEDPANVDNKDDLSAPVKEEADDNFEKYVNSDGNWEIIKQKQVEDYENIDSKENTNDGAIEEADGEQLYDYDAKNDEFQQDFEDKNVSNEKHELEANKENARPSIESVGDEDTDLKVQEEIELFLNEDESVLEKEDDLDDYQVEDNRSGNDKSENEAENIESPVDPNNIGIDNIKNKELIEETQTILKTKDNPDNSVDFELLSEANKEIENDDKLDNNETEQNGFEYDEKTSEEKKYDVDAANIDILANVDEDDNINLEDVDKTQQENASHYSDKQIDDESKIDNDDIEQLASINSLVNVESNLDKIGEILVSEESNNDEEETVDKVYEDLKSDLDKLLATMDKLADNDSPEDVDKKVYDDIFDQKDIADYEEEYQRPYREGIVLQQREDYDESIPEMFENENNNVEAPANDEFEYVEEENADDSIDKNPKPIPYVNDALFDKNKNEEQNVEGIKSEVDIDPDTIIDNEPKASKIVEPLTQEELSSAELNDRMSQFVLDHVEDLDVNSEDFAKNVAPINIHLKQGEIAVIESPGYPGPYLTNNIIDWQIDGVGEGIGIEMNITDLVLNGIMGDYLLVKPGGVDETGQDGLVFSYMLRSERRYRFLDVDRMFVRFEAQPGMQLLTNRGFSMSVRLVAPATIQMEPVPEPEPVAELPPHRMLVFLGGLSPGQFRNVTEEFRMIVADMATMFVNRNGIELGEVTTAEVTQVTNVSTCNINWPGFELCTGVRFGVPLGIEGDEERLTLEDLHVMWRSYVDTDPFDARLKRMGVTEFAVPNERTTLMVWLVIGFGVLISASMLALALWKWSCLEDYNRINTYSDTDSVLSDSKRNLDLYPTPHQTLPPLYDDDFLKYEDSARVDMGGINNKGYSRAGDLFDLESDDDITVLPSTNRDRSSNIQPKDIYPA